MHERHTAMEFSVLFKGPVDCSEYGDLELHDKYLSGIPSCIYHKIELETFTMWEDADKHATAEDGDIAEHLVVHLNRKAPWPASMWPLEKATSLAIALAAGGRGTNILSAPIAVTSTPIASPSASTSAASANTKLADLMAQVKSMCEKLEHYWAMKEESF
ncbi:hypothetical protein IEO21_08468 [Rhodonia placenta]|uniref:Uncharacterized protein n=1 Tax=Rhodonia placenta TaxID=104341 RepID=A0A8H7NW31_9APHY|nr:hypothetical protein IEO21_08468 [Postia placenta]